MIKSENDLKRRRCGRPRGDNYSKLNFYLFFCQMRTCLRGSLGREPTDTEVLQQIVRNGGYQPLVAADQERLKAAQKSANCKKSIASLRPNSVAYRTKTVTDMKTLRNFYGLVKELIEIDPTFQTFADAILKGKPLAQDISGYSVAWRPSLQIGG